MASRADNFNRSDSSTALGTPSDAGSDWVAHQGTFGISSNKGYLVGNAGAPGNTATLESSASDAEVAATLTIGDTGNTAVSLCARLSDANNYLAVRFDFLAANEPVLVKCEAGTETTIISDMGAFASGDVMAIRCVGNTITVYKNAGQIGTVTESFNNTATKHGLYHDNFTAGSAADRWDDFSITDLGGGGGGNRRRRTLLGAR